MPVECWYTVKTQTDEPKFPGKLFQFLTLLSAQRFRKLTTKPSCTIVHYRVKCTVTLTKVHPNTSKEPPCPLPRFHSTDTDAEPDTANEGSRPIVYYSSSIFVREGCTVSEFTEKERELSLLYFKLVN
jgi:hypothetical protein